MFSVVFGGTSNKQTILQKLQVSQRPGVFAFHDGYEMTKKLLNFGLCLVAALAAIACTPKFNTGTNALPLSSETPLNKIALESNGKKAFIETGKSALTVIVFLSPECPLCKNYSLTLNSLYEKYKSTVQFYGLVPGRTYSKETVAAFASEYKIGFPVWIDQKKEFSIAVQATVTPEVVVLDKANNIIYRGAIDDWVQALGKKKLKPQQLYLADALAQYLQTKSVLVKQTSPVGCLINEF